MKALFAVRFFRLSGLMVAAALLLGVLPAVTSPAQARSPGNVEHIARDLFNRLNDERRARGIQEVAWDGDLAVAATQWSARMSDTRDYRHSDMNATLATSPYRERFEYIGENIYLLYPAYESAGYAHRGWMQSEGHRRNMLNSYHDAVGIGVICDADGTMWATLDMGRYRGSGRPQYDDSVPANPIVHNNDGGPTCRDYNRPAASVPAPVPLPPLAPGEFRDVNGGPHAPAIKALALRDIARGCTKELFCPTRQVTRAQMATFIVRARKLPATNTRYFNDLGASPHAAAINALAAAGITGGCGAQQFCPNEPVSRAQMASFLQRAWQLPIPRLSLRDLFSDITSSVHRPAINAVAKAGIARGCGDNRYCPNQPVSRAEMASFLARTLKLV